MELAPKFLMETSLTDKPKSTSSSSPPYPASQTQDLYDNCIPHDPEPVVPKVRLLPNLIISKGIAIAEKSLSVDVPNVLSTLKEMPFFNDAANNLPPAPVPQGPTQTPCNGTRAEVKPTSHSNDLPEMLQFNGRKKLGKSSRSHYFKPLIGLLTDFFKGKSSVELSSDFHRIDFELALKIMHRKFGIKSAEDRKRESVESIKKELSEMILGFSTKSFKRIEENNKFVFKHTLKWLKQQFKRTHESASDEDFYHHYFDEVIEKNPRLTLANFFDPLNNKGPRSANAPKTLSFNYIDLVFKSQAFKTDFERYISEPSLEQSEFLKEYIGSVPKKLEKIFYAWEKKFEKSENSLEVEGKMLDYFEKNHQCKLPWTRFEVILAVQTFLEILRESAHSRAKTKMVF